ncbi:MAG: ABC transporter permease subunit [Candidatus Promineifilaceae bacterium]
MPLFTIAELTIREAQRRRILWVALVMGLLFLALFGTGLHFIIREFEFEGGFNMEDEFMRLPMVFLTFAGLYVTNFLVVIMSVLLAVATISSEIESKLIDTLITKPVRRWEIVIGKWLGFAVMSVTYVIMLAGGVLLIMYIRTGLVLQNVPMGIAILALNALIMLTVTIAGGTRLSTLANGVLAFMLYGLAFIGGWVETIGSGFRNETAINLGILSSLLVPIEALWRKASVIFEPSMLGDFTQGGPFTVASEPSDAMLVYALLYIVGLLLFATWSFGRRDL